MDITAREREFIAKSLRFVERHALAEDDDAGKMYVLTLLEKVKAAEVIPDETNSTPDAPVVDGDATTDAVAPPIVRRTVPTTRRERVRSKAHRRG